MFEFLNDFLTLHFAYAFGIVILGGLMHGYTGLGWRHGHDAFDDIDL
mgnify:CR=1 FL=1